MVTSSLLELRPGNPTFVELGEVTTTNLIPLPELVMRVLAFAEHYPCAMKPYLDTQFIQFLRDEVDLAVMSAARQGSFINEAVVRTGLDAATRHFPMTLKHIPACIPRAAGLAMAHPRVAARRLRIELDGSWKSRLVARVRMLTLPAEPPDACLIHNLNTATLFWWLGRVYPGASVCLYYHGGELPGAGPALADASIARAFRGMDVVLTNTGYSAREAVERGCPPEKLHVIPLGYSLDTYAPPDPREYAPDGVLRLISVSRLHEEKGVQLVLQALAQLVSRGLRALHFTVVGDGALRPDLQKFVMDNALGQYVEFTGELPTREVACRMGRADVLVLASVPRGRWVENQACVIQEAMLMGCIIVASATGGVRESNAPDFHDLMVEPGNVDELSNRIARLHNTGVHELRRLGGLGRAFAEKNYDVRHLNARMLHAMEGPPAQAKHFADAGRLGTTIGSGGETGKS